MEQKAAALAVFAKHQIASISLLKRTLCLGHHDASALMETLVEEGVVSSQRPDGIRVLRTLPDARNFSEKVFETAVSFREFHLQNNNGHTQIIKLLSPCPEVPATELRKFMFSLYRSEQLSVIDAARRLAEWAHPRVPSTDLDVTAVKAHLDWLWDEHEDRYAQTPWPADPVDSEFHRLARYIHMEWRQGRNGHTGIYVFISKAFVPRGKGHAGTGHEEHVVPRKFLMEHCKQMFRDGRTLHEVAQLCRENTIVVEILKAQASRLDRSVSSNGLGLKTTMPGSWSFGEGCVFARLHAAGIAFAPPVSMPACKCAHAQQSCD